MKVFLSWSGECSHKVALVFRDWLPAVIQSLEPYVSSEDIDKGARWSTDIAAELDYSTFGIICVTKENIDAPWLNFEAGALSKTMDKSFVSPFLYNVKRSEVHGPILQFQSTIFEKEDVRKLINTLNKACGELQLKDALLGKAFDVWWPTLEEKLNEIESGIDDGSTKDNSPSPDSSQILEEILDISRMNQKLIRTPENETTASLKLISTKIDELSVMVDRERHFRKRRSQRFSPDLLGEMLGAESEIGNGVAIQIVLSLFKDEFPWLYDAGNELSKAISSNISKEKKREKILEFMRLVEFTSHHPVSREVFGMDKTSYMMMRELPYIFGKAFQRYLD